MGKFIAAMINALEDIHGNGRTSQSVRAIKWLGDYLYGCDGARKAVGHALSRLSKDIGYKTLTDHSR